MNSPNFVFKLDIRCDELEEGMFEMKANGAESTSDGDTTEQEVRTDA